MKTAIHICILLILSAVVSLSRAAHDTAGIACFAEPDRASSGKLETTAMARRASGD